MIEGWTSEDIEEIFRQLNERELPFADYEFSGLGEELKLLGKGGFSNVYAAESKKKGIQKREYAIKVIGFGNNHIESDAFMTSAETQKNLSFLDDNILKIYDYTEICVEIHGDHDVVRAEKKSEHTEIHGYNCINLQFILMERCVPVFSSEGLKHKLHPQKLSCYDENEIIKLAYDVGLALNKAHNNNLMHRDVKLENVFYDYRSDRYKLGDFGISRHMNDGMVSKGAFTKGYSAPEVVGTLEDKYDCTADIYSFGMMLYVLLNELKFPGSENYNYNLYQYMRGYVPPKPFDGSPELVEIVLKMLSYNPKDRYQSMEEVLTELDKLKYGRKVKYNREHEKASITLSIMFGLIGAITWKMSFAPEMILKLPIWLYIILGIILIKNIGKIIKGKTDSLLFGIISMEILAASVTYLLMNHFSLSVSDYSEYRAPAVTLIALSFILLFYHWLVRERDVNITKRYLTKNTYWICSMLYFLAVFILEIALRRNLNSPGNIAAKMFGNKGIEYFMSLNPRLIGICGMSFCLFWIVREWGLMMFGEIWKKIKRK